MNRWIRYPMLLSGICVAISPALSAAPSGVANAKCGPNQDRVWVYDSLTSFDVEAKLPCGETVQIVSRVKGYVRIRTASGVDGYVPDSAFPDLPPFQEQYDPGAQSAAPSESASDQPTNLGTIAAAYRARAKQAAAAESPATPAVTDAAPAAQPAIAAAPALGATSEVASSAPAKSIAPARADVTAPKALAVSVEPAPAMQAPLPEPATPVWVAKATPPVTANHASALPPVAAPSVAASAPAATPELARETPLIPVPTDMPAVAASGNASIREIAAKPAATVPETDDYPETEPQNASADPNCRVFFSAYGLGAEQYKWLSDERHKQFQGICPAPNLQSVDFVILFTHDSDSYITAMPTPVHTDGNGFSDFDPMTTVDSALMSPAQADKAHYELAWVFRVQRGAFDPGGFSPRRRPQYAATSKGAHASTKAVEDAFNFIEQQSSER